MASTPPKNPRQIMPIKVNIHNPPTYNFDKCVHIANTDKWHYLSKGNINISKLPVEHFDSIESIIDKPGVYTYVLFTSLRNIMIDEFRARRVITPGEVLSKHRNIVYNSKLPQLLLAGEAYIEPGRIVHYNFASGTYMPKVMEEQIYRWGNNAIELLSGLMTFKWEQGGANAVYFNPDPHTSFIINYAVPKKNINTYVNAGYILSKQFNTEEKCKNSYFLYRGGAKKTKKRRSRRTRRSRSTRS